MIVDLQADRVSPEGEVEVVVVVVNEVRLLKDVLDLVLRNRDLVNIIEHVLADLDPVLDLVIIRL